ncbi:MaoC family dehydratase [Burkholderia cepacia]|uniref:MaoC family dehydratase n=1 Tax=Burkholderia cepacia TaxID=292 RepID=UPI0007522233|nr:MaoC family dehydratase [Burkholderia cepacia]KVK98260.1 dehydratase [Burkholderia cepacia]
MKTFKHLPELESLVGQQFAECDWFTVDQSRIDLFARATDDYQWIHIDPIRAADTPAGATIAHGFLTLALLPKFFAEAFRVEGVRVNINYGLNRVRFPTSVPVNSRVRARLRLLGYEVVDGGVQLSIEATIDLKGEARPACVAEFVTRHYY